LGPQSLPAGTYYLLQDLLYRAVALTNSTGVIVEAYDTDAYGNTLIFTAADSSGNWWSDSAVQSAYGASEIIYCGYRYDPESQLYYVRYRTYSPILGRWLQRDPIGYAGGVNLYACVKGRPVARVDALGLSDVCNCAQLDKQLEQNHTQMEHVNYQIYNMSAMMGMNNLVGTPPWQVAMQRQNLVGLERESLRLQKVENQLYNQIQKSGCPLPESGYGYTQHLPPPSGGDDNLGLADEATGGRLELYIEYLLWIVWL
jgi:RHS repeat-associated protein